MIITTVNEGNDAESAVLANNLAVLRGLAGRNVLLISADAQEPMDAALTAVDIKPRASARTICQQDFPAELERLLPSYNDVVIDTADGDSAASRSALTTARVALIPLQAGSINSNAHRKIIERIETGRLSNPNLRVLAVIIGAVNDFADDTADKIQALLDRIPAAKSVNTAIHGRLDVFETLEAGLSTGRQKPADARTIADMSALYRGIFSA
ncbi:hypothetical protein [Paraherbaspirillum soli]|uniref:Uncharacterized protein n=1 Tax=Paraherbaspirillum soli TaxID=631222 RepID=A0ABW0M889_9BURK